MKLISKKDIYNSKLLAVTVPTDDKNFKHADVIHKGCRFSIGKAEFFKDLTATEQEYVGSLVKNGTVCFDNKENVDNGVIATIDAEVKRDLVAAKVNAANVPLSIADQIATGVAAALQSLGLGKKTPSSP